MNREAFEQFFDIIESGINMRLAGGELRGYIVNCIVSGNEVTADEAYRLTEMLWSYL